MLSVLKNMNLAVAFLVELAMLAAFAYFGFVVGPNLLVKIVLGLGLPIVAIVIWAFIGAPTSKRRWLGVRYWLLRVVLFGAGAVALVYAGQLVLGIILALVVALNLSLVKAWGQE